MLSDEFRVNEDKDNFTVFDRSSRKNKINSILESKKQKKYKKQQEVQGLELKIK